MLRRRGEDPTIWIGYADFLLALLVLFFLLFTIAQTSARGRPGWLVGEVSDASGIRSLENCTIVLGSGRQSRTDALGRFAFIVDSLREPIVLGLRATCESLEGELAGDTLMEVHVHPDDTTSMQIQLHAKRGTTVVVVPGDALFRTNEATLLPSAIRMLVDSGRQLKARLHSGDVVAVQGHTDDLRFPNGAAIDNWVLSGVRAAAAARVFTDPSFGVGIEECRIAIMGFGPSRPREPVERDDERARQAQKRERNRRIEFRILRGADISGTQARCPR